MTSTESEARATAIRPEAAYQRLHATAEFGTLRRRFRKFAFSATLVFLGWYLLYVVAAMFAHGFMSAQIVGNINVGLVFGLLQFVSTFLIAWLYSRTAKRDFDPLAQELKNEFDELIWNKRS